jgi:hypothetical protein
MFKIINKLFPSTLTLQGELKQKILKIAIAMLLPSLFFIDVINVRTAGHENLLTIFIKNIYLMIPWALAYLIAARHRDLLKIFAPLYISLMLLTATFPVVFYQFSQASVEKKFIREMANIMSDYATFMDAGFSLQKPSELYSADEYGYLAVYLDKFKTWVERFKQENRVVIHAFNEVELDKIFTDEIFFDFFNIIEKKKKLEKLSLFLDESAKRTEDIHSECVAWVQHLEGNEGSFLKGFVEGFSKSSEEKKFFREESYRIQKNIVQEYIKLLNSLFKAYGSYERKADGTIMFANENDLQTFRAHCEVLEKLFKEEETSALTLQEEIRRTTSQFL